MEPQIERECLCQYLYSLLKANGICIATLAKDLGKTKQEIETMLSGKTHVLLDDIIALSNVCGMKITLQSFVTFAHRKIIVEITRRNGV